jgi:GDPmannose 4,6-dehydratase
MVEVPSSNNKERVLITGITGQDGSYLAEFLLEKGYEVHGMYRRSATGNLRNIEHILNRINLHRGDLSDSSSIYRIISGVDPKEIYNEADQDHVGWSHDSPIYSNDITTGGVIRLLETIKQTNPKIKFFQPLSSNIFGEIMGNEQSQNEQTSLNPISPYACAKAAAYHWTKFYRETHKIFAATGIFFNHESSRRTDEYVTRKITKAAARISKGLQDKLYLGNIDNPKIDWGYSPEFMEAAWNIMQQEKPDDFVIGTGETHSVREFAEEAFKVAGISLKWEGKGIDEIGYDERTGKEIIKIDPKFFRPANTGSLSADSDKARKTFNFNPQHKFKEIIRIMVIHDLSGV